MFSKIIDAFRTNNSLVGRPGNTPNINIERRSSADEGNDNNNDNNSNKASTTNMSKPRTGSIPITFDPTNSTTGTQTTGAIGIKNEDDSGNTLTADAVVYPDGRRRSSLFGYSTNAADDYMQKDLLSSSWS